VASFFVLSTGVTQAYDELYGGQFARPTVIRLEIFAGSSRGKYIAGGKAQQTLQQLALMKLCELLKVLTGTNG
jgi:hypothetical protein